MSSPPHPSHKAVLSAGIRYYALADYYNYWAYYVPPYWNFYSGNPF